MCISSRSVVVAVCFAAILAGSGTASAAVPQTHATSSAITNDHVLARLHQPVSADFRNTRLEDAVNFLGELSGINFEPLWRDDQHADGLDKDAPLTLRASNLTVLGVIERMVQTLEIQGGDVGTWQLSENGTVELGPKSRLNAHRRLEVYDVGDLLMVVPEFANSPQLDLQGALQAGGGSGSSNIFRESTAQQGPQAGFGVYIAPRDARLAELAELLQDFIEPDQWTGRGGDGASLRAYQGTLIVNAPDYIHRQISGYAAK